MNAFVHDVEEEDPFEWLGREMFMKSMSYETDVIRSTGGEMPIGWEEKAGAFAKMESDFQKDLAYVLATGSHTDNTAAKKRVIVFLTSSIFAVADQEKKYKKANLAKICRKIAEMEFFFFLHDFLRVDYTVRGKLRMVGLLDIHTTVSSYEKSWQHFGDDIVMLLEQTKESAYKIIEQYKYNLYENS